MKTEEKLAILARAAKYDASCASSGSTRENQEKGIGNAAASGICHSWGSDGRCISLLKILFSNDCLFDCAYCLSRRSNSIPRATFSPEEVAELTINFYLRNYIEGLFLSSAVFASPDETMEKMIATCYLLRTTHHFNGYIHMKIIPGAARELVDRAALLADRLSVNIELPSETSLTLLAPQKSRQAILAPMHHIGDHLHGFALERAKHHPAKGTAAQPHYCPAGQSTQMIIGASRESDLQILTLTQNLYTKMHLRRVYYSAYIPVNDLPQLPALRSAPPLIREHRLYQADWLLRFYHFAPDELLDDMEPNLDERIDPKAAWALRNFAHFPLDVNRASYEELLRVPGLGVISAKRIIDTRRIAAIREGDLKKMGLILKRARYFLSINGKSLVPSTFTWQEIVSAMSKAEPQYSKKLRVTSHQLRLF